LRSWSISFWKLPPFLDFGADVLFVLESTVGDAEVGREKQTKKITLHFLSTLQSPAFTLHTNMFNIKKFYVLSIEYIYMLSYRSEKKKKRGIISLYKIK